MKLFGNLTLIDSGNAIRVATEFKFPTFYRTLKKYAKTRKESFRWSQNGRPYSSLNALNSVRVSWINPSDSDDLMVLLAALWRCDHDHGDDYGCVPTLH